MNNEKEKNLNGPAPEEILQEAKTAEADETKEAAEAAETSDAAEQTKDTETEEAEKSEGSEKSEKKGGKKGKASLKKKLNTPKFKHGTMALAMTAGFIVIVVLVNVVVGILGDRFPSMNWDMTKSSSNTLSDKAAEIVDGVTQPTEISLILTEEEAKSNQYYSQVAALMEKMAERNRNITVQYVDADANPGFVAPYTEDGLTSGGVLVKTEKRTRVVTQDELFPSQINYSTYQTVRYNDVDSALAGAVSAVNVETMPIVAFDTGHNEGMDTTYLESFLKSNNFDTVSFNLLTEEIPEEAQVVLLAVPQTDLSSEEAAKITAYLKDETITVDRTLMVLYHPGQTELPVLNALMNEWGLDVKPSVIVENDTTKVLAASTMAAGLDFVSSVAMTTTTNSEGEETSYNVVNKERSDYGYLRTPMANPVTALWELRNEVSVEILLTSSAQSQSAVSNAETGELEMTSEEQSAQNVAAVGTKLVKYDNTGYRNAKVMAFGSMFFFDESILKSSTFGNDDYAVDLFNFATGTKTSSAITSNPTAMITNDLVIDATTMKVLGLWIFTILIPVGFLVAGLVVFLKRRHL